MNRPSEELLHKTLENRATAAEAASVAEWLATDSGQAWASRYIGRDFDRQESCGDYEREEVASERIFARIKTALTRGRRRRILFRGNFPRRQPQGKLPRKECGKCGWQDRFDFPLMEGETVLYIIIRSCQTCSLVIPYMPIFL